MSRTPHAARAFGAGLVLLSALTARGAAGGPTRAAVEPAAGAALLASDSTRTFEAVPQLLSLAVVERLGSREGERREGADGLRDLPRFESDSATRAAAFGLLEHGSDPLARLALRGRRRSEIAVDLPFGARWTASAGALRGRAEWAQGPVLRGETSVLLPLTDRLTLATTLVSLYQSAPAESADSNTLQTLVGFSLRF